MGDAGFFFAGLCYWGLLSRFGGISRWRWCRKCIRSCSGFSSMYSYSSSLFALGCNSNNQFQSNQATPSDNVLDCYSLNHPSRNSRPSPSGIKRVPWPCPNLLDQGVRVLELHSNIAFRLRSPRLKSQSHSSPVLYTAEHYLRSPVTSLREYLGYQQRR